MRIENRPVYISIQGVAHLNNTDCFVSETHYVPKNDCVKLMSDGEDVTKEFFNIYRYGNYTGAKNALLNDIDSIWIKDEEHYNWFKTVIVEFLLKVNFEDIVNKILK